MCGHKGVGGGCQLNGHSAVFSLDGPSKDKEVGQTKTQLVYFRNFFLKKISSSVM